MGKLLELQSFKTEKKLRNDFWDPNFMTFYYEADIPTIRKTKEEFGKVLGLNYITRLIKAAIKKKTLLGKYGRKTGRIPQYIAIHFDKMTTEEFQETLNLVNKEIKKVNPYMKKDLMIIRNYIMNRISSSDFNVKLKR